MIFDVAAGTYSMTATPVGGKLAIHVAQGGSFSPSAQGTLAFTVSSAGSVGPAAATANTASMPTAAPAANPPTGDAGGSSDASDWAHVHANATLDPVVDEN